MNKKEQYITHFLLPSTPELRTWKFRLDTGAWIDIPNKITNRLQMDRLLKKHNPYEVYYSTCLWQGDRFLYAPEIVFDIDSKHLWSAESYGIKLIKKMDRMKVYKFLQIHYTASKGYRIIYKDNIKDDFSKPERRISNFVRRRKELIKKLPKSVTLDEQITLDPYRVIKMVGSRHLKTGRTCMLIPKKVFLYDPNELYAMTGGQQHSSPPTINTVGSRGGLRLSTPFYYFNVSNKINGVRDLFIPIILRRKAKYYKESIKDLITVFDMKQVYCFETHDMNVYVSFKPVNYLRCRRILQLSESLNYDKFVKEKQVFWRISPFINETGDMESRPVFKRILGTEKYDTISLPHHYILTHNFQLSYINDCKKIGKLNNIAKIKITD